MPDQDKDRRVYNRLINARWVLAAAALVLTSAFAFYSFPPVFALTGFAFIAAVAALVPLPSERTRFDADARAGHERAVDAGLKLAVDALPSAAIVVDGRGLIRYLNHLSVDWFGNIRPGEPLALKLRLPALLEAFDRVVKTGRRESIQWTERVPTERLLDIHICAMGRPGLGSARGTELYLLVVHDLTEQHRLEKMRADFVANASHELRTPLASLTGFIETLQGPARDDPAARDQFLEVMLEQANRMARLIGDLLSLSRIEMRAHVHPETVVDLGDIVRHTADALGPLAKDLNVEIQLAVAEGPYPVNGDRDELIQVFENLVENGLKYGGSGKRVEIGLGQAEEEGRSEYRAWVRDWGPGIAREHQPRLTERFYRVDAETSRQNKGTGLGLAIVKHILTRHRARLSIESEPGQGAAFKLRFDRANMAAESPQNQKK